MTNTNPFGFPNFDPSKMDPAQLMKLSVLIQQLGPDKLNRLQRIMHNMQAGFDIRTEMEEFEKSLPPSFREQLAEIVLGGAAPSAATSPVIETTSAPLSGSTDDSMTEREARLTVLRAVAEGKISPEEAETLLRSAG